MLKQQKGFTLIELMVVIALMGMLSGVLISMGDLIRDFRVTYIQKRVYYSLILAKSEAIKRNTTVSVCRSPSGSSCSSGNNWNDGWIVFTDKNDNRQKDGVDNLVRVYNNIPNGFKIAWAGNSRGISFDAKGRPNHDGRVDFKVCMTTRSSSPIRLIAAYGRKQGSRLKMLNGNGSC
ncbi:GspH/FimT family pseudopilin [Candidatus Sororendozoicomonas aggregata]|uniref:GspH/FimT family pseudopilin n=1 Tax=Candidatus Sororendozoicomonas aggregata TaxID=3073239 RepID=UPI002ED57162